VHFDVPLVDDGARRRRRHRRRRTTTAVDAAPTAAFVGHRLS
jgi:hypothetical protein